MPQKSNPITSELIVAAARTNAALLSAMHQAQIQEHERATHGWQVEWLTLPQMILLTGGALKHALYLARESAGGRGGDARQYCASQRCHSCRVCGVCARESMPRPKAEELVKQACAAAAAENRPLIETVRELAQGQVADGAVDWKLVQPENYLGQSTQIDRCRSEKRKANFNLKEFAAAMNETTKTDKLVTMREAISAYVKDGCSLAIEGFTGFISFAAGHEIIRQKAPRPDLDPYDSRSDLRSDDRGGHGE